MNDKSYDSVNNPKHYDFFPDMQAIDVIRATLTPEEYKGYLKGNALKYRLRAGEKDNLEQDIAKSNWYRKELTLFMNSPKIDWLKEHSQEVTAYKAYQDDFTQ